VFGLARADLFRKARSFVVIGALSTAAYLLLYDVLRGTTSAFVANACALGLTTIGNTSANRRFTFGIRERAGLLTDHLGDFAALGVALAITTVALLALNALAPGAPRLLELAVVVAANALATVARFAILGRWLRRAAGGRPAASQIDDRALPRTGWIALAAVVALAAGLFLWQLDRGGFANTYYAAAAQAASQSWSALFFGSLDAGNFITVDKPPFALWVMGLSVRLFGLSSWSILAPEALAGVATVIVLFDAVRRSFGYVAGLTAALVLALTPVAVLMFRYNNPDAVLTLLLVLSAWALVRALETGHTRWLVLSAIFVGCAFNTKFLQAFIVLPALGATYLLAARGRWRRRVGQLSITAVALAIASGWWMAVVDAIPADARPFIGGSDTNLVRALVLGYDGLGRLFGQGAGGPGGGDGAGFGFSGAAGWLRLFNTQMAGEASWLIPFSVLALAIGLLVTLRARRTDRVRAGFVLWGLWLLTHAAVFSFSAGIIHSYYEVIIAPSIGALVGGGVMSIVRLRRGTWLAAVVLAVGAITTAAWAADLLARTPSFVPGLGTIALVTAFAASALFFVPFRSALSRWVPATAAAIALAAMLVGPASYSLATVSRADAGGDPHAGPAQQGLLAGGPRGMPPAAMRADGPPLGAEPIGEAPIARVPVAGAPDGGGPFAATMDRSLLDYLLDNYQGETWLVAVNGANEAAAIQLATGKPVMAMGGFSGMDAAPTLDQLKELVRGGKLRYVIAQSGGPDGRGSSVVSEWIIASGTPITIGGITLYDLGQLERNLP